MVPQLVRLHTLHHTQHSSSPPCPLCTLMGRGSDGIPGQHPVHEHLQAAALAAFPLSLLHRGLALCVVPLLVPGRDGHHARAGGQEMGLRAYLGGPKKRQKCGDLVTIAQSYLIDSHLVRFSCISSFSPPYFRFPGQGQYLFPVSDGGHLLPHKLPLPPDLSPPLRASALSALPLGRIFLDRRSWPSDRCIYREGARQGARWGLLEGTRGSVEGKELGGRAGGGFRA